MTGLIALIVTAVGAVGAVFALRQNYRQRIHQIEAMYVQRFWTIFDRFSLRAISGRSSRWPLRPSDQKAVRAYLRLCEDELEVRAEGWVGDTAFFIWRSAIRAQMRLPLFDLVWQQVQVEDKQTYRHLARLLDPDNGATYDSCRLPRWRRWIHGLTGMRGA